MFKTSDTASGWTPQLAKRIITGPSIEKSIVPPTGAKGLNRAAYIWKAELDYLMHSRAASTALAENDVGLSI